MDRDTLMNRMPARVGLNAAIACCGSRRFAGSSRPRRVHRTRLFPLPFRSGWLWAPASLPLSLVLGLVAMTLVRANPGSTIHPTDRYAYAPNLGWIDARANGTHGLQVGEFVCAGLVYGANFGWLNLGNGQPANGIYYQNNSHTDFGVNRDPLGHLSGWAWGANIGWVVFTNRTTAGTPLDPPRVNRFTGRFSGFAYSPNTGWIALSNLFAHVKTDQVRPGIDQDGDGIPDAWELLHAGDLQTMNRTSNLDGDLATDWQEYLADTDPLTPGDELRITSYQPSHGSAPATLTWTTRPTRIYRIETRPDLSPASPWRDIGLGWFPPDHGGSTTRGLPASATTHFLRIQVARPLAP